MAHASAASASALARDGSSFAARMRCFAVFSSAADARPSPLTTGRKRKTMNAAKAHRRHEQREVPVHAARNVAEYGEGLAGHGAVSCKRTPDPARFSSDGAPVLAIEPPAARALRGARDRPRPVLSGPPRTSITGRTPTASCTSRTARPRTPSAKVYLKGGSAPTQRRRQRRPSGRHAVRTAGSRPRALHALRRAHPPGRGALPDPRGARPRRHQGRERLRPARRQLRGRARPHAADARDGRRACR